MTAPKNHHPGQLAEIARRTSHRAFFFRPGADTRELLGYMFGRAAVAKHQVPHVASALSDHLHLLLTDRHAERSAFMQQFFSNTARKRNLQLGRRENLWACCAPGDMVVLDMDTVVERVLYVALQPVAAGLVQKVSEWTGFQILPRDWGQPMRFRRPAECGEQMPEFVEFVPQPPPGFEHLPLDDVIAFFERLIAEKEREYAARRKRPVRGIRWCERQRPTAIPKTPAPMRRLNPRFTGTAVRVGPALASQKKFRAEHSACRRRLCSGDRTIVFPAGTLQMRVRAGVDCGRCGPNHPCSTEVTWTASLHLRWGGWMANREA